MAYSSVVSDLKSKKSEHLSKKSIFNIANSDAPSNHRWKKIFEDFIKVFDSTRRGKMEFVLPLIYQKKCYRYNDTLKIMKANIH